VDCPYAEIMDLRHIAWSNLGGLGPNNTHGPQAIQAIIYYNVFNAATNGGKEVNLWVSNETTYEGDPSLNGNSMESEEEFQIRIASDPNSDPARIYGAYGAVNVKSGTNVELKFEFRMNSGGNVVVPHNVVAMTFLDIDQPEDDETAGGESVGICTGRDSWGRSKNTKLKHEYSWQGNEKINVCHNFSSGSSGDDSDNPWNPANIREDGSSGLEEDQRAKLFAAAFWNVASFRSTMHVNRMDGNLASRNFLFAGHANNFCLEQDSCMVKKNYCQSDGFGLPACLEWLANEPICLDTPSNLLQMKAK